MFHWICPECGREIPPTVRECAVCDPRTIAEEPAPVGVVEAPTSAVESASLSLRKSAGGRIDAPRIDAIGTAVMTLDEPPPFTPDRPDEHLEEVEVPPLAGRAEQLPLALD